MEAVFIYLCAVFAIAVGFVMGWQARGKVDWIKSRAPKEK